MRKKRITHLIRLDGWGGTERALQNFIQATQDHYEHNVISISPINDYTRTEFEPVSDALLELEDAPYPDSRKFDTQRELQRLTAKQEPDIILSWMQPCHLLGSEVSKNLNIPLVWYEHQITERHSNETRVNLMRNVALSFTAPNAIAYSSDFSKRLHEEAGCNPTISDIVLPGIDTGKFSRNEGKRSSFRASLGLQEDDILIGTACRYSYEKDFPALIKIISDLVARCKEQGRPVPHFLLTGNGVDENNQELVESLESRGVTDYVHLRGIEPDIQNVFSSMDIQLFPTQWETFGLVCVEGLASGVPFIGSDVAQHKNMLGIKNDAGDTGTLFRPRDGVPLDEWEDAGKYVDALVGMMDKLSDPTVKEQIINATTQRAKLYDISVSADKLSGILDAEMERGKQRPEINQSRQMGMRW